MAPSEAAEASPAEVAAAAPAVAPAAAARAAGRSRPFVTFSAVGAFVLAFALGALADRELAPAQVTYANAAPRSAVAAQEAPPSWVARFAKAFCDADAEIISTHVGGELAADPGAIAQAFADRKWNCSGSRYLGGGTGMETEFYVFALADQDGSDQWWVFTVHGDQVVGID